MNTLPVYVVITPARNEAEFIEGSIQSMVAQTVRPAKWVIVSDGSTDGTDDIVKRYAAEHSWIELVRTEERAERHFAGKVHAFYQGYERFKGLSYEVIASLDADITFDPEYFAFLLQKLTDDPALGLVGTPFQDNGEIYDYRFVNIEHVSGACQVFRRTCFESIGGYVPVRGGGIDFIAVTTARMKGWKTRTFTEKVSLHHRKMGTAEQGAVRAKFKNGIKDYVFGNHPVWELFRSAYQMIKKPVFIGGLALLAGYLWAFLRRANRPISQDVVLFCQREQLRRLRKLFGGSVPAQSGLPNSRECV
jgi:glycosyltransferase involved in cell wall biosynthesis